VEIQLFIRSFSYFNGTYPMDGDLTAFLNGKWFLFITFLLRACLQEKNRTGVSFTPGCLLDFVPRLHDDYVNSYRVDTKGDHMLIKY